MYVLKKKKTTLWIDVLRIMHLLLEGKLESSVDVNCKQGWNISHVCCRMLFVQR